MQNATVQKLSLLSNQHWYSFTSKNIPDLFTFWALAQHTSTLL